MQSRHISAVPFAKQITLLKMITGKNRCNCVMEDVWSNFRFIVRYIMYVFPNGQSSGSCVSFVSANHFFPNRFILNKCLLCWVGVFI